MIEKVIEEVKWREEIEEEISRIIEVEKIKECGIHILRKRKVNRKLKYKQKGRDIERRRKEENQEICGEKRERKVVKAKRRKKVEGTKKETPEGGPHRKK